MSEGNFLLNPEIRKVFIISPGRTGTEFLAKQMPVICNDIFAIHEPDRLSLHPNQLRDALRKIMKKGIFQSFVKKVIGKSGTRILSISNINKKIESEKVYDWLYRDRKYLKFDKNIYFESNWQLFGIIEHLVKLPNTVVLILVRDSMSWTKSWINRNHLFARYKKADYLSLIDIGGFIQTSPKNLKQKIYFDWEKSTRKEKFIWLWGYIMKLFWKDSHKYSLKVFKYEDLFLAKNLQTWRMLIEAVNPYCHYSEEVLIKLLKTVINANSSELLGGYGDWSQREKSFHQKYCSEIRAKLGYDQ